ncbi:Uncharacterised protein [uncultured archaeon]|nr:Uncharacterised protein [uncultured archaeon]
MDKQKTSIIGIDLGQTADYTAITVIEKHQQETDGKHINLYDVRYLERVPLNTSYPSIIDKVKRIYNSLCKDTDKKPILVLDVTGVGRAVFDSFVQEKLNPVGISIHGGNTVTKDGNIYNVPKRDLAGVLQVLYQSARIKVSSKLRDAQTLNNELLNFKIKINIGTGHDSYEAWRESIHDDLVLSVACAAWYGEKAVGNSERYMRFVVGGSRHGFKRCGW